MAEEKKVETVKEKVEEKPVEETVSKADFDALAAEYNKVVAQIQELQARYVRLANLYNIVVENFVSGK